MPLLITQQEMVLIKNSEEAKNTSAYGNLYECLNKYSKLSETDLKNNIVFDKKACAVIHNNKSMLLDNIKEEWRSTKYYEAHGKRVNCQLCGTPNIKIHYITNNRNGIELHIGSECVKNYNTIDGIKMSVKNFKNEKKERLKQQRKIEFESFGLDDVSFISNAENYLSSFPIMLPYKIFRDTQDIIYNLNLIKTSYINSGGNQMEVIDKFNVLRTKFNEQVVKVDNFYKLNINKPLVCKKYLSEWLLSNDSNLWEHVSKNNAFLDCEALKFIYLPKFIAENIQTFNKCLVNKDINITGVEKTIIRFVIKNNLYPTSLTFTMPIKYFMKNIGCYCMTNSDYVFTRDDLVNISIEDTKSHFNTIYNRIHKTLVKHGYDFIIENKTNQAYWKRCAQIPHNKSKWSNRNLNMSSLYMKSSIQKLLSVLSSLVLLDDTALDFNFKTFVTKMESGSVWITQREKDHDEEIIAEARGLQKRKDFIHYK